MSEAAPTVEDANIIAFKKFEEIAEEICDLADKNLKIGEDLVAQFHAVLEKLEGEDVEETEDLKENIKEELKLLREKLTQQLPDDLTPESRDSKLSSFLASSSFRTACGWMKNAVIGKSGVKTSEKTGLSIRRSTTSPDGTITTTDMFLGTSKTFAPTTPKNNANNSQAVIKDEK